MSDTRFRVLLGLFGVLNLAHCYSIINAKTDEYASGIGGRSGEIEKTNARFGKSNRGD